MKPNLELETLESRELLASSLLASLNAGILRIEGTAGNDVIHVRQTNGQISVDGISIQVNGSQRPSVGNTELNKIEITSLGGQDLIWINSNVAESLALDGGSGSDLLVFGSTAVASVTPDSSDVQIKGDLAPLWKQLESAARLPSGEFSLGTVQMGAYSLRGVTGSVDATGVSLKGQIDVGPLGAMTLEGKATRDGAYSLEVPLGSKSLFNGFLKIDSGKVTLTQAGLTLNAEATVAQLGKVKLTGSLAPTGTYSLDASFQVAGQTIQGAKTTLGSDQFHIKFALPVSSIGKVNFEAAYNASTKAWLVSGTYPAPVQLGPVTLKNITLTLANDRLTVSALGTIAGVEGLVDARATGTLFYDGRIDLKFDARFLSAGGVSLGNAVVTFGNNHPGREYRATFTQTVGVAGLTLSDAKFTLTQSSGLTFSATWNYLVYSAQINGSIDRSGRVRFSGSGGTAKLPSGFSLGSVSMSADLDRAQNSYKLHIEGQVSLLGGKLTFSSDTARNGTWPTPTFKATGKLTGPLSKFGGNVTFTMEPSQVRFEGNVRVNGFDARIVGTIQSNGQIKTWVYAGDKVITQLYKDGLVALQQVFQNGSELARQTYENGKEVLQQTFSGGKEALRRTFANGQEVLRQTFADGKETMRQVFVNTRETFRTVWQSGGRVLESAFAGGKEILRNTFVNGANTFRQTWDTSGRYVEHTFSGGKEVLRKTWDAAGNVVQQTWDSAGNYAQQAWNSAGKFLGNGANEVNKILDRWL